MTAASPHYLGERGAAYHDKVEAIHRHNARVALKVLRPHLEPHKKVLDFGCADGELLAALATAGRTGIEVNPASRARAVARGLEVHPSTRAVGDATIDLAVSSHVLEHTLRPLDELIELRRVLKPDGEFVLVLPLEDWRVQKGWSVPDHDHHLYAWTPQVLANLLSEAGYEIDSIEILTYALPGRFTERLHRFLPGRLFDAACRFTAVVRRRRQLVATARPRVAR